MLPTRTRRRKAAANGSRNKLLFLWISLGACLILVVVQIGVMVYMHHQVGEAASEAAAAVSSDTGAHQKKVHHALEKLKQISENLKQQQQVANDALSRELDIASATKALEELPSWLGEYVEWHRKQRLRIATPSPQNWKDHRYLIMQCIQSDPQCGGASDRIKPIPLVLYVAYLTNRIFLIWWDKPCALEEFMVPNDKASLIDWTVPDSLRSVLASGREMGKLIVNSDKLLRRSQDSGTPIVRTRLQSFNGGEDEYLKLVTQHNHPPTPYQDLYHHLFSILFRPSPHRVEPLLRTEMKASGLEPANFAVAHYRAFYRTDRVSNVTLRENSIRAVNCASNLVHGGPVYFCSDSTFGLKSVQRYATETGHRVVIPRSNQQPLHLDKATSTQPQDYANIFVDLYILWMSRCVSFGQGGFGKFGLLLSHNSTCFNRHMWKRQRSHCDWIDL